MVEKMSIDADLYDSNYFGIRNYGLDKKREKAYRDEVMRIWAQTGKAGSVLDIGCGMGDFLMSFDDRWTRYGIDPSIYADDKARKKGIEMIRNLNSISSESMDVVVFRGTLQHIDTPMESLIHAARILKKGGLLVILATPDADSIVYQMFGTLPALEDDKNWVVFGHRCLRNIIKRLGMKDIEITHPYWSTPYARPLRDFANFVLSIFFGWRPFAFPGNMMEIYAVKK